ncbi:MAG TPA: O-antigen ligase family protein [Nitriliruptorales bacterium]|nr:O-antigen ligase family protein [Nitriliruptorales bacterium]
MSLAEVEAARRPTTVAAVPSVARPRLSAEVLLTVYLGCLYLISAKWVVAPFGAVGTPAILVGLVAATVWLTGRLLPDVFPAPSGHPVRTAVLLHAWIMGIGWVVAQLRPLTELETNGANRAMISLVALSGVALLTADGVRDRAHLDRLLRRLTVLAAVISAIGVVQFATGWDLVARVPIPGLQLGGDIKTVGSRGSFNRPYGTTQHPIELSVVLAMCLPIALHYALTEGRRRRSRWVVTGLIAAGIPLTVSRSGVVAAAAALITLGFAWPWRRRLQAMGATVGFIALNWMFVPGLIGTFRKLFLQTEDDPSIQARLARRPKVMELFGESPWFGRGYGTFSVDDYFILDNQYYKSLIEGGVVGILAIAALLLTGIAICVALRRSIDRSSAHLAQALAAALLAVAVSIATFDAFFYRLFTGTMFFVLGCAGALWRVAPRLRAGPGGSAGSMPTH